MTWFGKSHRPYNSPRVPRCADCTHTAKKHDYYTVTDYFGEHGRLGKCHQRGCNCKKFLKKKLVEK